MNVPKYMPWNIFCALVRLITLEQHHQENAVVFFHHMYDCFILCDNYDNKKLLNHTYLQVSKTEGLAELH